MKNSDLKEFNRLVELILNEEKTKPVAQPIHPDELFQKLELNLQDEALPDEKFFEIFQKLIENTPKTASSHFFNQLIGGRRSKAVLGDLIASVLNNSMYTYKVAGPMVGVEKSIIHHVGKLINYPASSDGTIAAGSSMSNFMAMILARDKAQRKTIKNGVSQRMTLYTSDASHYSVSKNASLIGIGKDQVKYIPTDDDGKMIPSDLASAIEEDLKDEALPFMIIATSGTTVLGAFDDLQAISEVAKNFNIWLHVDGAYGGAVMFSEERKQLMSGIEHTDSFGISAHKMLGTPLTCSVFITKHKKQLFESFASEADYLYQTQTDDYNLGKSSFQCGRRNDALKLWTLWKSLGTKGMGDMVNHQFELADIARKYVANHSDYSLYGPDDSTSVCFNYKNIPPRLLSKQLHLYQKLLVSHGSFKNKEFIRLVTINSDNTFKEILEFFNVLESFVDKNPTLFKNAT